MAIYKNREVSVNDLSFPSAPTKVTVVHKDGMSESAPISQVHFTQTEKDALIKEYPHPYESLNTATDEDIKSVRVGVAPSYDPSYKARAKSDHTVQKSLELDSKHLENARNEIEKQDQEPQSKPTQHVHQLQFERNAK
jgi:hypothetical protein